MKQFGVLSAGGLWCGLFSYGLLYSGLILTSLSVDFNKTIEKKNVRDSCMKMRLNTLLATDIFTDERLGLLAIPCLNYY